MGFGDLLFKLADVHCEQCQTQLKLGDVNAGIAMVCSSCKHEMPIQTLSENTAAIHFDKNLIRPSEHVSLQREGSIFSIEKKWRTKFTRVLTAVALIWNALILVGSWQALHGGGNLFLNSMLIMFGFVGLVILYRTLQELFNTTTIMLKNDKLVVGTAPLYWGGMKIYRTDEIASFTVWRMNSEQNQGRPRFAFGVDLHTKDGRLEKMCPANDLNEAIYIEKTIEELLHIESGAAVDHFAV